MTVDISSIFRFFTDFGAVLGTGNRPEIDKKRSRENEQKKDRAKEQGTHWRVGGGGLTVTAGEVRRGSPSGYGGIPARFRGNLNTPSTPMGYGELRTLRETAAPRKVIMRMGGARDCKFCAKGERKL